MRTEFKLIREVNEITKDRVREHQLYQELKKRPEYWEARAYRYERVSNNLQEFLRKMWRRGFTIQVFKSDMESKTRRWMTWAQIADRKGRSVTISFNDVPYRWMIDQSSWGSEDPVIPFTEDDVAEAISKKSIPEKIKPQHHIMTVHPPTFITLCKECDAEVNTVSAGDEGWTTCTECGAIEMDTYQVQEL